MDSVLHTELMLKPGAILVDEPFEDARAHAVEQGPAVMQLLHGGNRLLAPGLIFGVVRIDETVTRQSERRNKTGKLNKPD